MGRLQSLSTIDTFESFRQRLPGRYCSNDQEILDCGNCNFVLFSTLGSMAVLCYVKAPADEGSIVVAVRIDCNL